MKGWQSLAPSSRKRLGYMLVGSLFLFLLFPYVRLVIATHAHPVPQVIFVLGGDRNREEFAAKFSLAHTELPIWISSGSPAEVVYPIFETAGVDLKRVNLDFQAVDTVTNFTIMVDKFKKQHIHHVYLLTSDYHMNRAKIIAAITLGSRGITYTPIEVSTKGTSESWLKIARDLFRSYLWLLTSQTGSRVILFFEPQRAATSSYLPRMNGTF